jgi:hypothetical protein
LLPALMAMMPAPLAACPFCAMQDNGLQEILVPIFSLLGAPFVVFGIIAGIVVRNVRQNKAGQDRPDD